MVNTSNMNLPLIAADQSQKHVTHNEALKIIDAFTHLSAINRTSTSPPGSPTEGDQYIIAAPATGDWAGRETQVVVYVDGVWVYIAPRDGWIIYDEATEVHLKFNGGSWTLLFSASGAVMDWVDYNDTTTATTPIQITTPGTYYNLTNDGAGAFTNTSYASSDTASIWDTVNQRFDFRNLNLGDTVDIRVDMTPTTGGANDGIDIRMDLGIDSGGGSAPYSLPFGHAEYRYSGSQLARTFMLSVYMGDANTRDNFGQISVSADGTGCSVINSGWWYRRIQR